MACLHKNVPIYIHQQIPNKQTPCDAIWHHGTKLQLSENDTKITGPCDTLKAAEMILTTTEPWFCFSREFKMTGSLFEMKHGYTLSQQKLISLHSSGQKTNPPPKKKKNSFHKTHPNVSGTPNLLESWIHISLAV